MAVARWHKTELQLCGWLLQPIWTVNLFSMSQFLGKSEFYTYEHGENGEGYKSLIRLPILPVVIWNYDEQIYNSVLPKY